MEGDLAWSGGLKKGIIKRLGPGSTINIWEDNWLPGTVTMKPLIRLPGVVIELVSQLFLPGTRCWDEDLVRAALVVPDAEEILRLRPGFRMEQDTTGWSAEKNGLYSVRSAYRLLKAEQSQMEAGKLSEPSSSVDALTLEEALEA
jgi:hypothetical protein